MYLLLGVAVKQTAAREGGGALNQTAVQNVVFAIIQVGQWFESHGAMGEQINGRMKPRKQNILETDAQHLIFSR
jgi:hypothetical protein